MPPQGLRGQFILNSRVLAIALSHIFRNSIQPGTILHLRERHTPPSASLPQGTVKLNAVYMDLIAAEKYVSLIRDGDMVGFVSSEPDREILFPPFTQEILPEFGMAHWMLITVKMGNPLKQYDLMIGAKEKEYLTAAKIPTNNFEASILGTLIRVAFLKPVAQRSMDNPMTGNEFDKSTMLNSLVDYIPQLSEAWEYCAVLTTSPEKPNHLRLSAISRNFPKDIQQEVSNILVEPGQPLTGWAFQSTYPIVIQHTTGTNDPRLAYQYLEKATSAIAIPTKAQSHVNGALYIGTRKELPADQLTFNDAEIRVLQIVADVIGEVIERNRIRRFSENSSSDIITIPPLTFNDWGALRNDIGEILEKISRADIESRNIDNMHLTIIRVESHPEIFRKNPHVSEWLTNHIIETTRTFFVREYHSNPRIYLHNISEQISQISKFVCLVPNIVITDDRDRELRAQLRKLLSSLRLPFSFEESLPVSTHVWSMPFRYKGLKSRIAQHGETEAVLDELITEVEDALVVIPYIENAHQFESEQAFSAALEQYLAASYLAPNNRYIQRHIAKAYAAIGDLKNSAVYWGKIVSAEPHPSHYLRYANVLARLGNARGANETYKKAYKLESNDPRILMEWGDFLAIDGGTEEAIKKYEAALKLEVTNRDLLWLRLADVHFDLANFESVHNFVKLVLDRQPDNQEARRMMLKVLKKMRRK